MMFRRPIPSLSLQNRVACSIRRYVPEHLAGTNHTVVMVNEATRGGKKHGSIADTFTTHHPNAGIAPLPAWFSSKKDVSDNTGVLKALEPHVQEIISHKANIIPRIPYQEIEVGLSESSKNAIRKIGVVIITGVPKEALASKLDIEDSISTSPVKGFPAGGAQQYELYNTKQQIRARTLDALLNTQKILLSLRRLSFPDSVHFTMAISYFDRRHTVSEPSRFVEDMKGALFPSELDVIQTTSAQPQALAPPSSDGSPSDFWGAVEKHQGAMRDYVHKLLNSAAVYFDSTKFTDITSAMRDIVNTTATFHDSIQETLRTRGITLNMLTEKLEGVFTLVANELETRPSADEALGYAELANMIDEILGKVTIELESLFQRLGVEGGAATGYMCAVKPHIQTLVVAVCEINKQYPSLFPALAFCVAVLLIQQGWILRPFLSLLGFGPAGSLKGSAVAWLQRYLWGAVIKSVSWSAWLQVARMGVIPVWANVIAKVHSLIGRLFAMPKLKMKLGSTVKWLRSYF